MIGGVRCVFCRPALETGGGPFRVLALACASRAASGVTSLSDFLLVWSLLPLLLAQEGGAAPAKGGGGGGGGGDLFGGSMFPMMIIITAVMFYLLMMRPEQRKRKEMEKQLSALKKNDHVVTTGGIVGTVLVATEGSKTVTLRIDDSTGTKMRVLRSAIMHIGAVDEAEGEGKAKPSDK
jgi:preprotein translocase subunit YajC